ncbi:hypothetical protein J1N35_014257 [Gossypium stocksii]|uniref:Uncharacterized protein n=1 Tax=Gossypium stocksii TaxID=47602 RepID=A0A9D3VW68_9ROSI|nr:hypothetical protein J1N35_014257 [Gossypium stocksii]
MSKGFSGKVNAVVPVDSGRVASAPKFKRRKVSAIRDFLPGCGTVTTPNWGMSEFITVDRSSEGDGTRDYLVLYVIRSEKCRKAKDRRMMPHNRVITHVVDRAHEYGRIMVEATMSVLMA